MGDYVLWRKDFKKKIVNFSVLICKHREPFCFVKCFVVIQMIFKSTFIKVYGHIVKNMVNFCECFEKKMVKF